MKSRSSSRAVVPARDCQRDSLRFVQEVARFVARCFFAKKLIGGV